MSLNLPQSVVDKLPLLLKPAFFVSDTISSNMEQSIIVPLIRLLSTSLLEALQEAGLENQVIEFEVSDMNWKRYFSIDNDRLIISREQVAHASISGELSS